MLPSKRIYRNNKKSNSVSLSSMHKSCPKKPAPMDMPQKTCPKNSPPQKTASRNTSALCLSVLTLCLVGFMSVFRYLDLVGFFCSREWLL